MALKYRQFKHKWTDQEIKAVQAGLLNMPELQARYGGVIEKGKPPILKLGECLDGSNDYTIFPGDWLVELKDKIFIMENDFLESNFITSH